MVVITIKFPGPTAQELAYSAVYINKGFNPLHIRPSGVGLCQRAQVLTILHALYPDVEDYKPRRPDGKDGLATAAAYGNSYEDWRYRQSWLLNVKEGRVYGGSDQYNLAHPDLVNVDGTPVVAHPDIVLEVGGRVLLDEEIKTTGSGSRNDLPKLPHLEQRLLRQYFWKKKVGVEPFGRIHYGFRGSFTDPRNPVDFEMIPHERGMLGLWNEKIYPWEYIEELNQRLVYIRDCVERQVIPGRHPRADSPEYYECHFASDLFQAECPWREDCWKEELEYERRPAVLVADADGIVRELVLLKERRCELDKESRELTKRIKELQKRLDPFFDEFGDRIMAGGVVIERVLVKVPERQQKAFEYHKYEVKLKG